MKLVTIAPALLAIFVAAAQAQTHYQVVFSKPASGFDDDNVNGINAHGRSVGYVERSEFITRAAAWPQSEARTFLLHGPNEPETTIAIAINDHDDVVGQSGGAMGGAMVACLWQGTSAGKELPQVPGSLGSLAAAISNSGIIVGYFYPGEYGQAVVWTPTHHEPQPLELGAGDTFSSAYAVNDAGLIVGSSGTHAALWSGGQVSVIPDWFEGSISTQAVGVDAAGDILLRGVDDIGVGQSAWLQDGVVYELPGLPDFPAGLLVGAAMNAAGVIVGSNYNQTVAVRWSGPHGQTVVDLNHLIDPSYVAQGWTLIFASAISSDGRISGNAVNSNKSGSIYRFTLTPD